MDFVERADAFVITLDLPGVSHDAIDLTFDQGALTIRGYRPTSDYAEEDKVYVAERTLGDFRASRAAPGNRR